MAKDEGAVDDEAQSEVEGLKEAPLERSRGDIAPDEDGRRPGHGLRGKGDEAQVHGPIGDQSRQKGRGEEGDEERGVVDDGQPEDHDLVDVEEHGDEGGLREGPVAPVLAEEHEGKEQTERAPAAAHEDEDVEKGL